MRRTLLAGSTWLLLCAPLLAQSLGTITGAVKDSTGAVVPGATVTVVNKGTNATRTTSSNEVGLYDFPALPPGLYTVMMELQGFKKFQRENVSLLLGQTITVNASLEVGGMAENVTVWMSTAGTMRLR